ncbi:MAG: hypothetical protein ACR2P3_07105 [Geminicoccaceae bacterium]
MVNQEAPIGGWNARDALDNMPPEDAVCLDNWYPGFGSITLRKGFTEFADTVGAGAVETLATLQVGSVNKFLAASSTNVYDISSGGTASSLAGSFTSGRWQTAVMDSKIGLVNGADAPQTYDGTTFGAMTVSGTTVAELIGVNVFKSRSYFWKAASASFWYSAVDTLGGVLTEFPLGNLGGIGGNLQQMITWTVDGGSGVDDLAVFIMTTGDVIIYQGSDPGDASDWALIGVYKIGAPIGIRGAAKVAGDAIITTVDGYVQLSSALNLGRTAARDNISDKIINAVLEQTASTGSSFGWQLFHYPAGRRLMFNYPKSTTAQFAQHVVNLETGAWSRFAGMNASSWGLFNDLPYFGGAGGKVYRADTGTADDGANIDSDARQAYSYLRMKGVRKQLTQIRILLESEGSLPIRVTVDTDFGLRNRSGEVVTIGSGEAGSPWDTSPWDTTPWASGPIVRQATLSRGDIGDAFSVRLRTSTNNRAISWNATNMIYRRAGVI